MISKTTAMAQAEAPPRLAPGRQLRASAPLRQERGHVSLPNACWSTSRGAAPAGLLGRSEHRPEPREGLDPARGWSLPPRRERPARPVPPPLPAACSPIGWIWIRSAIGRSERECATTNQKAGRAAQGSYKRDRALGAVTRDSRQFERR